MHKGRLIRHLVVPLAVVTIAVGQVGVAEAGLREPTALARGARAHTMKGGEFFDHPKGEAVEHDQELHVKIPQGFLRVRDRSEATEPSKQEITVGRRQRSTRPSVTAGFSRNTSFAARTSNDPVDPSTASDGISKAVYVTNEFIALSVDGGLSFTSFNPGSFYADFPDGGVCCDQIVQFVPSIDRFVWLDQYWAGANGRNRYRLAVFTPAAVSGGPHVLDLLGHHRGTLPGADAPLPGLSRPGDRQPIPVPVRQ